MKSETTRVESAVRARVRLAAAALLLIGAAAAVCGCGSRSVQMYVDTALSKMESGDYETAARLLERAVEKDPEHPTAQCNLGIAYDQIDKTGPAIQALRRAADLCPDNSLPLEFLAHLHIRRQNWAEARRALEQAHQRSLLSPRVITARALVEFQAGEFQEALAYLNKALEADPNYAPALYDMAVLYQNNSQRRRDAVEYFRRYLRAVSAGTAEGAAADERRVSAARAYVESGGRLRPPAPTPPASHMERPLEPVATRSAVSPPAEPPKLVPAVKRSAVDPLVLEARTAAQKEDFERALILLKRAVAKDPQDADALWELGQVYGRIPGQREEAARIRAEFRQKFPDDLRVTSGSAGAAATGGNVPARTSRGDRGAAMKEWGMGLDCQKNQLWETAVRHYRAALELDDTFTTAWYNLGLALRSKGDRAAARDAFARALELEPGMANASFMLAVVYWEGKDAGKAFAQCNRTQAIDSKYANTYFLLGTMHRERGESELSRKNLQRYLELAPANAAQAAKAREWLRDTPASSRRR